MYSNTNPGPDYEWDDVRQGWKRKPGTHSGARNLQRKALVARKNAIERGDNVEWTTQNSFYYELRTIFLANGINPEIEGRNFRKAITNQTNDLCRELGTTREDLRIIADVRATLYHRGERYHVSLRNIVDKKLFLKGTDVIIIEKAALCNLLSPLAAKVGVALLDTKGYVVEYAKVLSQNSAENGGHISMITDFDADGLLMAFDVHNTVSKDIYRIGIDFDTIDELIEMYPELEERLVLEKLEESYTPGTSIKRLKELNH